MRRAVQTETLSGSATTGALPFSDAFLFVKEVGHLGTILLSYHIHLRSE